MRGVCAWCQDEITSSATDDTDDGRITHGICIACLAREFGDVGVPLASFLDSIDAPVAVVDDNVKVLMANRAAVKLLGKPSPEVCGLLGGEVFGCIHAKQPEGCGKTIHCSACAIRNSVAETMRTGKLMENTPAVLKSGSSDNPQDFDMLITTEKANGVVLLRIEEIKPAG